MASKSEVSVVDLHDHTRMVEVSDLFDAVWGRDRSAGRIMSPEVLTAIAHAGGQVSAAFVGDELVGATAAFLGRDDELVFLHSHISGVVSPHVSRGVGRRLKWHQREWCLERGIRHVRWTFDPLVRRNAWFNLGVLGARAVRFERDVYGPVPDARNAGFPTDRLLVDWELDAPRVRRAAEGHPAWPDVDALRRTGAEVIVDVGGDGRPVVSPSHAPTQLVRIPEDIERHRVEDPPLAREWAEALRATLGAAMDTGTSLRACTPDGWLLLATEVSTRELAGR